MKVSELVSKRRSVRSFTKEPLSSEDMKRIMDYAESIDNPYGIAIWWQLLSARKDKLTVPVITGGDTYITGKMKALKHSEEAFGFSFEKLVLYAQSLGIGTTWIAGTMDRKSFEEAICLKEDEVMPCISPLGYPSEKMSFREAMMRKGIKADERMSFESLFFKERYGNPLTAPDNELKELLELVRLAPSAVNKQPWRVIVKDGFVHFYEKKDKGYAKDNGWDVQKIDMGIALAHFALGLEEKEKDASLYLDDPQIEVEEGVSYIASFRY